MKLLDQIRLACDGATVEVPHNLGTATGRIVGFDFRNQPVVIVAVGGRDVPLPLEVLDEARVVTP